MLFLLLLLPFVESKDSTDSSPLFAEANGLIVIPCIKKSENVASVKWYMNEQLLINHDLKLKPNTVNADKAGVSVGKDFSLTLMDLNLNDTGNYSCRLFNDNGEAINNVSREVIIQAIPDPPGKPEITEVSSRWLKVSWPSPVTDNNSPILRYQVHIKSSSQDWSEGDILSVGVIFNSTKIRDLRPYTKYQVKVFAENRIGPSRPSEPSAEQRTDSEVPTGQPTNIKAHSLSPTVMRVSWEPPFKNMTNGELSGYQLIYGITGEDTVQPIVVKDSSLTSIELQGLRPYTNYTVLVKAFNSEGDGPDGMLFFQTMEGLPSKPRITHCTNVHSSSLRVNWEAPKELNGRLLGYQLVWQYNGENFTKNITTRLQDPMSALVTRLKPYTEYVTRVAAITGGGRGNFSNEYPALTDVSGPSAPNILNLTVLSSTSIHVQWDIPEVVYKDIDGYLIQLTRLDRNSFQITEKIPKTESEATVDKLFPNKKYSLKVAGHTKSIFSQMTHVGNFSEVMYFELKGSTSKADNNEGKGNMTAVIVAGTMVPVIVILIIVLVTLSFRSLTCREYYQAAYNYLAVPSHSQSSQPTVIPIPETYEEADYPSVAVRDFIAHVELLHADSDIGFSQQFDDITQRTRCDLKSEFSALQENKMKNRYINIAAYDHTRCQLKPVMSRQKHSDYINANYVDGYNKARAYIATQGPLPQTVDDFWRMVWEQNTAVIVMITNLMERGRRKCDQYWPNEGTEDYGVMSVRLLSTFARAHYTVRIFSLRNTKKRKKHSAERVVYQYHYTEWPDHGVPDYTLPVLTFVRKSAAANPPGAGPIVVHCSAGVGRTGTYILIDSMMQQIKEKGSVNVAGFLLHIRQQRNFLVQTEDQYMFIHDVLVEYILGGGDTEIQDAKIMKYFEDLEKPNANGENHLERQFLLSTCRKPKEHEYSQAVKPVNVPKNRIQEMLPIDMKRVLLPVKPGVDGSDYINASYLQGYNRTDEFIITQHPLESTVEDFWRMVWDQNSAAIVLLTKMDNDDCKEFWPEKGDSIQVDAGNFKLFHREEDTSLDPVTHDFIMESTQDDYVLMSRIIATTEWPDECQPLYTAFEFIETCRKWYQQYNSGPIIVIDKHGGCQAALFCALWTLYDQLHHDKSIDVYQVAKLYHLKRTGIIGTKENYHYLYKAIDSLCKHMAEKEKEKESYRTATLPHHRAIKNGMLPNSNCNGPWPDM
ncbi:tyrosine-protein phosphatase 99A-like isoform X2 [Argonauta hians]